MAIQYISIGLPSPIFINETGTNDYISHGSTFMNESSITGPTFGALIVGVATQEVYFQGAPAANQAIMLIQ